jgi:ribonuclease-3
MNLKDISLAIGVSAQNEALWTEAFTHKSFANENKDAQHNERLEFLGDAVLELVVTDSLFAQFPDEPEGKMTKFRSALVSGVSLSAVSKQLGIAEYIRLSHGEQQSGGKKKDPILADLFEAVVGAIYLESGLEVARSFIHKHLLPRLPEVIEKNLHLDPKSAFQELSQEKWEVTPEYNVLSESGPDHNKIFSVGVFVGEKKMGEGEGTSKQKAEVAAAENALGEVSSE